MSGIPHRSPTRPLVADCFTLGSFVVTPMHTKTQSRKFARKTPVGCSPTSNCWTSILSLLKAQNCGSFWKPFDTSWLASASRRLQNFCKEMKRSSTKVSVKAMHCRENGRGKNPQPRPDQPPWLRIKDRFRGMEDGSQLRKELGEQLRALTDDGKPRFSTMRGT